MKNADAIASTIRHLRAARQLSQFRLAVASGLSPTTISHAERFGFVTRATAERLATALGVPVEQLLDDPRCSAPGGRP